MCFALCVERVVWCVVCGVVGCDGIVVFVLGCLDAWMLGCLDACVASRVDWDVVC